MQLLLLLPVLASGQHTGKKDAAADATAAGTVPAASIAAVAV
jgi:hypothetical protein